MKNSVKRHFWELNPIAADAGLRSWTVDTPCDLKAQRVRDLLQWAVEELKEHNIQTPRLDAEVLLAYAMNKDRLQLYLSFQDIVDKESESHYRALIAERAEQKPVSYLVGRKEFMSLDFIVNESVMIPRPETEVLVETVCGLGTPESEVLELGTGSGAIAVSLARYNPEWHIVATDLSMKALLIARENARLHRVTDRVSFLQADLLSALSSRSKFDWLVSNPPYIPAQDLAYLPAGIRKYEPMLALDGGVDGLDVIRRIVANAHTVLKPGGRIALEIGYGQSEKVQEIADETGKYSDFSVIKDYSGIPRVFHFGLRGDQY